jgi:hypothetical protein
MVVDAVDKNVGDENPTGRNHARLEKCAYEWKWMYGYSIPTDRDGRMLRRLWYWQVCMRHFHNCSNILLACSLLPPLYSGMNDNNDSGRTQFRKTGTIGKLTAREMFHFKLVAYKVTHLAG